MSDGIISADGSSSAVTLKNGRKVPFQVVQDIYNEITGKKESLSKSVSVNHKTSYEDIMALRHRVEQTLE